MTDKRSGSQQRRANQNKAARQSLAARKAAAAEKAPAAEQAGKADEQGESSSSKARWRKGAASNGDGNGAEAVTPDAVSGPDDDDAVVEDAPPPRGGRFGAGSVGGLFGGGLFGGGRAGSRRAARVPLGPSPVPETDGGAAGFVQALRLVRGAPFVLGSLILALISVALFGFVIKQPPSLTLALADVASGGPAELAAQTPAERFGALTVATFLGFPAVISGVALAFLLRQQRRRVWFIASIVQGVWILLSGGGLGLLVAALLWFGTYQTTKAERLAAAADTE